MQNWLQTLLRPFHNKTANKNAKSARRSWRPMIECLEDRTVPSTLSSIASNFNGTAIPAGDSIWFNAAFKASGLGAGPVSLHVTDQVISFNAGGTSYSVSVPDSIVNFSAANTVATTSFDVGQNAWVTNLPMSWSGNAFLGGASFFAASGLPGGVKPVTWSGNFATDTGGVSLKWQWGAAVYTSFSSDNNDLNVKPLDSNSATLYHNSDHAGTPEAFKSFVIGGARGGGGSNWTGSYSSTTMVVPETTTAQEPATISGTVTDEFGTPLFNAHVFLKDSSGNIVIGEAYTDAFGNYTISNVPPGTGYTLNATLANYKTISATAGTDDGVLDGTSGRTMITEIGLDSGDVAIDYDFVLQNLAG